MNETPILVDLVVRSDAPWKSGGDLVQIAEYAPYLRAEGFDLREVPFHPAMRFRPGAIVHVFNVDRPFDFAITAARARRRRLIVSPIRHSVDRVRAMRAADRGRGAASLAGRMLPEGLREWLGTLRRSARQVRAANDVVFVVGVAARTVVLIPSMWRHLGPWLDRAEAVALLAHGEGAALAAATGWRRENVVLVPNGRPEPGPEAVAEPWADRPEGSIAVVGRIEPRKRQLEIAREADRQQVRVEFVGPRVSETDEYTAEFDRLAATSPFVQHLGGLPRPEVLSLMGRTRVLLNASWVEVQSLVDVEAAFMGCRIVASDAGHSKEWLGESVIEVRGGSLRELVASAAHGAAAAEGPSGPPAYDWTWGRAAEVLAGLYRKAPERVRVG